VNLLYLKVQLKYPLIIWLALTCFDLNAQKSNGYDYPILDSAILYSDSSLKISYERVSCKPSFGFDQEVLIFSFINLTSENLKISWHSKLYYNGVCKTCDYPDEYTFELLLPPNALLKGDCLSSDQRLIVFSKFIDSGYKGNAQLTGLNIDALTIQK
jgi:hypothetical protein